MGGASLYIETSSVCAYGDRSCRLNSSGMGPVMEESTKIAHTFARRSYTLLVSKANEVHLHVPDGATLEDGAASDCAMVTALLSPAMNKQARRKGRGDRQLDGRIGDYVEGCGGKVLAMAGELSLVGKMLLPWAQQRCPQLLSDPARYLIELPLG